MASGHRTVADTHGGHAGPLAAAPTIVPDARPWLAATPRVVLTFTGRLSCWVRKPLYPSEANLSDPSTTFTERGAASPVRSDKGRSHFTGAECAIGTDIDMAALWSKGAEFGCFGTNVR